ncbi:hypothetical protein [Amycolatopsis viridis]|uniref:Integral membrane protein n=1 Tax=Amycolatopsis viridis TaxID=185678 RepID=A0ABX0SUB3_9PSEU|nr:hypothetical protein [Amycolatopsis viridis]NIH80235.1 hypothetical protein [Amycolatopsis viridis]
MTTGNAAPPVPRTRSAGPLIATGGLAGLTWAAALRGVMAEVSGPDSTVTWYGTFGQILLPGAVTGALLAWAEHLRRTGGRRRWRLLALAPLTFPAAVLLSPETVAALGGGQPLFSGGIGGGALAMPLFGMAGGYAIAGRGRWWARLAAGAFAVTPIPVWVLVSGAFGPELAVTTPRGAWVAVLFSACVATLALACAVPHGRV